MFATLLDPSVNSGVGVGFTDRLGGVSAGEIGALNLGRTDVDDLAAVQSNMAAVLGAVGLARVVALNQVHGNQVLVADEAFLGTWGATSWLGDAVAPQPPLPVADAVVTRAVGVGLAIRVADCVPVLLADPVQGVIGAAHAGRAGLLGGVLEATVAAMARLGATQLTAWLGPHICGRCYELPADLVAAARLALPAAVSRTAWGTPALDLGAGCNTVLQRLGVQVYDHSVCTLEADSFFSYRRQGAGAGRQIGLVWQTAQAQ